MMAVNSCGCNLPGGNQAIPRKGSANCVHVEIDMRTPAGGGPGARGKY